MANSNYQPADTGSQVKRSTERESGQKMRMRAVWSSCAYIVASAGIALICVVCAWPDNSVLILPGALDNKIEAAEDVLSDRLAELDRLQSIIREVKASESKMFTANSHGEFERSASLLALFDTRIEIPPDGVAVPDSQLDELHTRLTSLISETKVDVAKNAQEASKKRRLFQSTDYTPSGLKGSELARYQTTLAAFNKSHPPYLLGQLDLALGVIVAGLGAFGACVQGISSIAIYVGMRKFQPSWFLFYVSRPFVGAGTALGFFLVVHSGVAGQLDLKDLNLAGNAAVAILVGMFSAEAMEKLRGVAGALFKSKNYTDSQDSKTLVIDKVTLSDELQNGQIIFTASIAGQNFQHPLVLKVNGVEYPVPKIQDVDVTEQKIVIRLTNNAVRSRFDMDFAFVLENTQTGARSNTFDIDFTALTSTKTAIESTGASSPT
jgi:hypothetical protein